MSFITNYRIFRCIITMIAIIHTFYVKPNEIASLYSMCVSKAAEKLYSDLLQANSYEKKINLIEQWTKQAGIAMVNDNGCLDTVLSSFEKKYSHIKKRDEINGYFEAISVDGSLAIRRDKNDSYVRHVVNLENGEHVCRLEHQEQSAYFLHDFLITTDNKKVIASRYNGVMAWNASSGQLLYAISSGQDLHYFKITKDNKRLLVKGYHDSFQLHDSQNGKLLHTLRFSKILRFMQTST